MAHEDWRGVLAALARPGQSRHRHPDLRRDPSRRVPALLDRPPHDLTNDFDIWKNIVRELSEELLGTPEHDGSCSDPIDYPSWPLYRTMCRARAEGKTRVVCLGAGLDALTLAATILTVVVIDAEVFDELFGDAVHENSEGTTVFGNDGNADGIEFSESNVTRLVERQSIAAPGAACLTLSWHHRALLLER
jgi:hypothetical protein